MSLPSPSSPPPPCPRTTIAPHRHPRSRLLGLSLASKPPGEFAPNSRKHSLENLQTEEEDDDGLDAHRHAEDFEAPSHADAHGIAGIGTSFRIARGNSIYNIPDMNLMDYGPLPKGPLTPETASEIIDVYRRGGKVRRRGVHCGWFCSGPRLPPPPLLAYLPTLPPPS